MLNDLVWTFPTTAGVRYEAKDRVLGDHGKEFWALDLYTGEVRRIETAFREDIGRRPTITNATTRIRTKQVSGFAPCNSREVIRRARYCLPGSQPIYARHLQSRTGDATVMDLTPIADHAPCHLSGRLQLGRNWNCIAFRALK